MGGPQQQKQNFKHEPTQDHPKHKTHAKQVVAGRTRLSGDSVLVEKDHVIPESNGREKGKITQKCIN
jgi:hypothetical protein